MQRALKGQFYDSPMRDTHEPIYAMSPWSKSAGIQAENPSSPISSYFCAASMLRHHGPVYSLTIAGDFLYTGSDSRRIRVWKIPELVERGCFKSKSGKLTSLLASNDTLFSAHQDHKIRVWQKFGAKLASIPTLKNSLHGYFHPDKFKRRWIRHTDVISSLAYNAKEGLLYSASWDKTVKVWSLSDFTCVDTVAAHEEAINAIVVKKDDGLLFTASADGTIKVWSKVPQDYAHTLIVTLKFQQSAINALALSGDETVLYSGSADGTVSFWEKEKNVGCVKPSSSSSSLGRLHHGGCLRGHVMAVLCLNTIERLVLSGSEDNTIRIWRREIGLNIHSCLAVLRGHDGPVMCIAAKVNCEEMIMGGDLVVYSGSLDRTVKVWVVSVMEEKDSKCTDEEEEEEASTRSSSSLWMKSGNYKVIPALSPSWVQMKLNTMKQ